MNLQITPLQIIAILAIGINFNCTRKLNGMDTDDQLSVPQYYIDPDNDGIYNQFIYQPKLYFFQDFGEYSKKFDAALIKQPPIKDSLTGRILLFDVYVDETGFVDSVKVRKSLSLERDNQLIHAFLEATKVGYAILKVGPNAIAYRMEKTIGVRNRNRD